jgi:hypothetical protein
MTNRRNPLERQRGEARRAQDADSDATDQAASNVTTAREAGSGMATGIVSPRDTASGQASGLQEATQMESRQIADFQGSTLLGGGGSSAGTAYGMEVENEDEGTEHWGMDDPRRDHPGEGECEEPAEENYNDVQTETTQTGFRDPDWGNFPEI